MKSLTVNNDSNNDNNDLSINNNPSAKQYPLYIVVSMKTVQHAVVLFLLWKTILPLTVRQSTNIRTYCRIYFTPWPRGNLVLFSLIPLISLDPQTHTLFKKNNMADTRLR